VLGFHIKLTQRIDPSSLGVPINIVYLELDYGAKPFWKYYAYLLADHI
jgi:hypothetical protein